MYLDVEMNLREKMTIMLKTARMTDLFNVPVESALLAEDVGAVRAHDPVHVVEPPHVTRQVRTRLVLV